MHWQHTENNASSLEYTYEAWYVEITHSPKSIPVLPEGPRIPHLGFAWPDFDLNNWEVYGIAAM